MEQNPTSSDMHEVLEKNIQTLVDQRKQEEAHALRGDRPARLISNFAAA